MQAIKFMPDEPECVLTSSIDGTVMIRDFEGRKRRVLLDTMNCKEYRLKSQVLELDYC